MTFKKFILWGGGVFATLCMLAVVSVYAAEPIYNYDIESTDGVYIYATGNKDANLPFFEAKNIYVSEVINTDSFLMYSGGSVHVLNSGKGLAYFCDYDPNGGLFVYDTTERNLKRISDDVMSSLEVHSDFITCDSFRTDVSPFRLYTMLQGKDALTLVTGKCISYEVIGDSIYYLENTGDEANIAPQLVKCDKEGNNKQVLKSDIGSIFWGNFNRNILTLTETDGSYRYLDVLTLKNANPVKEDVRFFAHSLGKDYYMARSDKGFTLISDEKVIFTLNEADAIPLNIYQDTLYYIKEGERGKLKAYNFSEKPAANVGANNIDVFMNGKQLFFDSPPYIKNNYTMVPMRAIFEELGATLTYDDATTTATAVKGDTTIKIATGKTKAYINGKEVSLPVAAENVKGRIMIPLRFVSEAFGATVKWNEKFRMITINS